MENKTEEPLYGYCPVCGAVGEKRERRPGGNDTCANGHTYPSRDALLRSNVTFSEDEEDDAFPAESDVEVLDLLGR